MTESEKNALSKAVLDAILPLLEEQKQFIGEIRQSPRVRAFQGGKRISMAPYGYDLKDKHLEPNEHAETVKRMFALRAQGAEYQEIVDRLNEAGIPSATGKLWKGGVVTKMLSNQVYRGRTVYQPWGADDAIVLETPWTQIVDTKMFEHVQARMTRPLRRPHGPAHCADRHTMATHDRLHAAVH